MSHLAPNMPGQGTRRALALAISGLLALSACGERTSNLVGPEAGETSASTSTSSSTGASGGRDAGPGGGGPGDAGPDASVCPTYQARCDGRCLPTSADPANCGGCGLACGADQVCFAGRCEPGCGGGLEPCAGTCVDLRTESLHCGACGLSCEPGTGCVDGACRPLVALGPPPARCEDGGVPVRIDGIAPGGPRCAGEIAETAFPFALCSCEDVDLGNPLLADAFDSAKGPYAPGQLGGSVGANGAFVSGSTSAIWGSLWAASDEAGVATGDQTTVLQELHVGGPLSAKSPFFVGLDAFVAGDITASSTLTVAGTLHQPAGASISGSVTYGSLAVEPVAVPPPCGCAPDQILPVAAAVAAQRPPSNDNGEIGLDPDVLLDPGGPVRLDLPCGRYYLRGIQTNAPLVVAATGRVALFVDGDVAASGPLAFLVGPAGELDVFVAGSLSASSTLKLGSAAYPTLARLYVEGEETSLSLTNDASLRGFVYAAGGRVEASNPVEVFGGVFARDFRNTGSTALHYDRRILHAGDACASAPASPPPCGSCKDCGNQACIQGVCGACASSADCCAPLVCQFGECVAVPQ